MGNRRLYKIECLHMLGTLDSERIKVAALNLFHPTVSPPFQKVGFFHIVTQPFEGGGRGWGWTKIILSALGAFHLTISCLMDGPGVSGLPS